MNVPQRVEIEPCRLESGQQGRLVLPQPGGLFCGMREATIEVSVLRGSNGKYVEGLREKIEARKVQDCAIHRVKSCWFGELFVQQVDPVDLALGHAYTAPNAGAKIVE